MILAGRSLTPARVMHRMGGIIGIGKIGTARNAELDQYRKIYELSFGGDDGSACRGVAMRRVRSGPIDVAEHNPAIR